MFSSFKEKLNTGLTSIQEKGLEAAKAAQAAAAAAANNSGANSPSQRPSTDNHIHHQGDLLQDPLSSPSPGSPSQHATTSSPRVSGAGSSSATSLFRRSLQTNRKSADLISFATSPPLRNSTPPLMNKKLLAIVQQLTLDPMQEKPDPTQLEAVKAAEPGGIEMTDTVIEKLERLQRYEARFPDLATAFKKLVQEKVAIEAVLKASTPLEDLSDVEALESHLRNMAYKSEVSMQEIKRLNDELQEAAKLKEVHVLESSSQSDMIENLQDQLATRAEEVEKLKHSLTASAGDQSGDTNPSATAKKQQERIIELEAKIKSLETQLASTPYSSLAEAAAAGASSSDPLSASVSVPETVAASAAGSGASSPKEKKVTAKDQKKKDQALRDLMARLEVVLKEKKQAQHEQEETEAKLLQLQLDLDKEIEVKKEMVKKLDELQKKVGEIEEKEHQQQVNNNKKDPLQNKKEDTRLPDSASETTTAHVLKGNEEANTKLQKELESATQEVKEAKESLAKLQAEVESAAKREAEALIAREQAVKKESEAQEAKTKAETLLAEAHVAQKSIKDAAANSEKELKIAKAQIKELQKLESVLQQTKTDLTEAQKQLDLARKERELAQKSLEEEVEKVKSEKDTLETKLKEEAEKTAESHKALADRDQELIQLRKKSQDLEQKVEDHVSQASRSGEAIENWQEQLKSLRQDIQKHEVTIATLTKERADLELQLNGRPDLAAELAAVTTKVVEKEQEVEVSRKQIESLTAERNALTKSDSENHQFIQSLQDDKIKLLEEWKSKVEDKERQLQEKVTRLEGLQQEFDHLSQEKEENLAKLAVMQEQERHGQSIAQALEEFEVKVEEKEEELQKKTAEADGLQKEVDQLNKEKDDTLAKLAVTQEQKRNAASKLQALERATVEVEEKELQLQLKSKEANDLQEEVDELNKQKDEILAKLAVVQEQERNGIGKIQALEEDLAKAKSQLEEETTKSSSAVAAPTAAVVATASTVRGNGKSSAVTTPLSDSAANEELRTKISELEAEIVSLNQVPSKNAQKKLRQELNHTKAAKQEAEALVATLKANLERAQAGSSSNGTEKTKRVESESVIEDLKKQIAELEKTIEAKESSLSVQQKKLHDEAERQELLQTRIQELEKTVATVQVLEQEKANLEARIATDAKTHREANADLQKSVQSLETKEAEVAKELQAIKEREQRLAKELDEANKQLADISASDDKKHEEAVIKLDALTKEHQELAKKHEELERARMDAEKAVQAKQEAFEQEMEALRNEKSTLEAKVKQLTKERDAVQEKVASLEKRLEQSSESEKDNREALNNQMADLTKQKEALTKDFESARAKHDRASLEKDAAHAELKSKHDSLAMERDEALAKLVAVEATLKVAQDEASKSTQDVEEKVGPLTSELEKTQAALSKIETQLKEVEMSSSAELQGLQAQIQTLTIEKDSLNKEKAGLESQLQDAKAQKDEATKLLKVMEEDTAQLSAAKAESKEKLNDLQSKINSLTMKDRDNKEALALAKSTIHQRDEELEEARKVKAEDEDKVQKSMTLLKTTRKQILRLEKEKQEVADELEAVKVAMAKAAQEAKTQLAKAIAQQSTAASDLSRLQAVHAKMAQDKEKLIQEKDQYFDQLQMKQAEFESSQTSLENVEHEMTEYRHQLEEARDRVTMLEEETSHAKRLAETKVAECEGLRRKALELESKLEQIQNAMKTRSETHRTVLENLQQEVEETKETLGSDIEKLRLTLQEKDVLIAELEAKERKRFEESKQLTELQLQQGEKIAALESEMKELKDRKRDLELELQHFKDLEEVIANERSSHAKFAEESKRHEAHLRSLNNTLKDEVRKLQKQGSSPSPSIMQGSFTPGGPGAPQTPSGQTPGSSHGRAMSPQSTPPSTPHFGRLLQQQQAQDDDVNVEYLKNVLLNFMEHKERRQQLVPVVAQVLKLTPDETKRLSRGA
ncbi:hypothetical protein EDD11_001736 [Mortierella claussenii]|nr:hypothetical protein EDD11_001736 [Mortierella claussenii]